MRGYQEQFVELKLPATIANIRSKRVVGILLVTRERTTYIKYVVRPPSSYVRYPESLPILPDPVLQDYLKEDLTFAENKPLVKQWQKYSQRIHSTSREPEEIQRRQDLNVNWHLSN